MRDNLHKIYGLLGFAQKAGKISAGTSAAKASLTRRKAHLLLLSNDIAKDTKEGLVGISQKLNIPWVELGNKYDLGKSVGKAYRVAITINDEKFAQAVLDTLYGMREIRETMGVAEWPE